RTLADVSHPNLVSLYELMSAGPQWFFTMELIKGSTFIQYVRPETDNELYTSSSDTLAKPRPMRVLKSDSEAETEEFDLSELALALSEMSALDDSSLASLSGHFDESRLRTALRQLAEGVNRLHEIGKIHRDIKPSNVLVTDEGRVVILDFGLVEDIEPELHETLLAGTPDYMSPGQGAQMAIPKASTWSSVGVRIFQGLAGHPPFNGRYFEGKNG